MPIGKCLQLKHEIDAGAYGVRLVMCICHRMWPIQVEIFNCFMTWSPAAPADSSRATGSLYILLLLLLAEKYVGVWLTLECINCCCVCCVSVPSLIWLCRRCPSCLRSRSSCKTVWSYMQAWQLHNFSLCIVVAAEIHRLAVGLNGFSIVHGCSASSSLRDAAAMPLLKSASLLLGGLQWTGWTALVIGMLHCRCT
jgi:hypothetical protein